MPSLKGLSSHTKGIVALGRFPAALHAQISSAFKIPHKFSLCLPASSIPRNSGAIYFGRGPYQGINTSKLLVTTPLVVNPTSISPGHDSFEYFINVKSIKVDGIPLRFNNSLLSFDEYGVGGTKIRTLEPYTVLYSDIYKALIDVFVGKAMASKMRRVASVALFGACFSAMLIGTAKTGPTVPVIDLVLEGKSPVLHNKNARWRIYGANSMVKVSNNVWYLGFVNGGSVIAPSIVIGGKQMEDNLVEFDLEANKLGVTSSLLRVGMSCSRLKGI